MKALFVFLSDPSNGEIRNRLVFDPDMDIQVEIAMKAGK
jgi:hypothetical protein